jgi:DNA repair protein RecO (recombination protein O)
VSLEKSEALVLRVIPFRDTSKILTVYTAEHGLVSLLAKGVRGVKPRYGAALELFAAIDLVYYQKDSRELQLLSQAMLLDPFLGLSRDLHRYAHAAAVLELLLRLLAGQEPPGRLYPLSIRTLECLEQGPRQALPAVFRAFEIKAVSFLGHRPEVAACIVCGRTFDGYPAFAPHHGGVVCHECAPSTDGLVRISPPALEYFRRLLRSPLVDLFENPVAPAVHGETSRLVETFLGLHLERYEPLRSLRLVQAAPN